MDAPSSSPDDPSGGRGPIALFRDWFSAAGEAGIPLPESMTLATATRDGRPSARMVLLKDVDDEGFAFFTNLESRKADELAVNPRAALVFHWAAIERQVRVEGMAERIPSDEAEGYFATRPRGSQIGAWASSQSRPLTGRDVLERRVVELEARFAAGDVPLPPFWGGYRVRPDRIEFWQGRPSRLHDRWVWSREGTDRWRIERLQP